MNDDRMFPLVILGIGAVGLAALFALRQKFPPPPRLVTPVEPGKAVPRNPVQRIGDYLDGLWYTRTRYPEDGEGDL